jgi:GTP-binding protein Era
VSETLRDGIVAVIGRPNAGKSTLVNALVGRKVAIVSPRPQTTRHRLYGVLRRPDCRMVFVDTPGPHKPLHRMNRAMMDAVRSSLASADVVVAVVEAGERGGAGTEFLLGLLASLEVPKILVLSKIDRVAKPTLLPAMASWTAKGVFDAVVPLSALKADGLDRLLAEIEPRLPTVDRIPDEDPGEPGEEFTVSEIVREALLERCGEEIPWETAVRIDGIDRNEGRVIRIVASILAGRPGQKKIIVGAGGSMIKEIGTAARLELERVLGSRVHLDLMVVVEEGWREDRAVLAALPDPSFASRNFWAKPEKLRGEKTDDGGQDPEGDPGTP